MRRMAAFGLVVGAVLLLGRGLAAAGPVEAPAFAPARQAPQCEAPDTSSDVQVALLLSGDDEKKCSDYGMYAADELKKCEKACQGNRKSCEKRQRCDHEKCPPPGYCWKCVER